MGKSAKKYIVSEDDQELDFDFLVKEWGSPFVRRTEVSKFSGGLLHPKTLANQATRGEGPPYFKHQRYIVYLASDLKDLLVRKSQRPKSKHPRDL
jgi:hypothetical protein